MIRNVLSIAGSDPSGGAGIQADLKSFAARGTYGMAALTALTAQNTHGVEAVMSVPPAFVAAQIRAVLSDVETHAIKIGMMADAATAAAVADALVDRAAGAPVVLDPVMVAKGGASLLDRGAIGTLKDRLFPMVTILTPNLPEAAALLGLAPAEDRAGMADQAHAIRALGVGAVVLKGGHLAGDESPDLLVDEAGEHWFPGRRIATRNSHGTGCSLSAALAAELAKGLTPAEALPVVKAWLSGALAAADGLSVGTGHGPVDHFHHMR